MRIQGRRPQRPSLCVEFDSLSRVAQPIFMGVVEMIVDRTHLPVTPSHHVRKMKDEMKVISHVDYWPSLVRSAAVFIRPTEYLTAGI